MSEWTLGGLRSKSLEDLADIVSSASATKPAAQFYTAELERRASLAAIEAANATKQTALWTRVSAIAIALTFIVTALGIAVSFYV